MAKKTEAAADAAPAKEVKYPGLSAGFLAPKATFKGRLKSVHDAFVADPNSQKVASFRQALQDGAIPGPTERVTHNQVKMLNDLGLELPEELLPVKKADAKADEAAPAAAAEDLSSAV